MDLTSWRNKFQAFLNQHPELLITNGKDYPLVPSKTINELAVDERLWTDVRNTYTLADHFINLNNGAASSSPAIVENAFLQYYRLANTAPSYYLWKVMQKGREVIREGLAGLLNCYAEEVAILRNTTEASNNIISGLQLGKNEEVVLSGQDYEKVVSAWKQKEMREGIKLVWVDIEPGDSDERIITRYINAFSEKTRILQLTHVINWNGQVIPVEPIIREAKKRGIAVVLDGAHSFGKLDTDMERLGCDYFFAAIHKWLSGPIPSALMYIRKEKIAGIWPLASGTEPRSGNIRKFEELSIQLYPNILAIGFAIQYHLNIGRELKEERLRHLRRSWVRELKDEPRIIFNTPPEENRCCCIVNVAINGWEPEDLENYLMQEHKVHVGSVLIPNLKGIRITPNIYTRPQALEKLVLALKKSLKS
jgi:selenocysteine lyase/cysteine desulfurase